MGKHVTELSAALSAQHTEIHVLTPLLRGGLIKDTSREGVHIHRVEGPHIQPYDFAAFAYQANVLMERAAHTLSAVTGPFDLLHAHDWLTANVGIALKHAWRRPLVATIHATERGRGQGVIDSSHAERVNHIEWWLTYEAWRVITCSHFMAQQVHNYFQTPLDKVDVVPNGIHTPPPAFTSEAERRAYRRRFAEDDQPLVFHVGRLVYEKGIHVLLDSWTQVLASQPGARLYIAGTGNCLDQLKEQAWSLGLMSSVVFTGYIADADRDRMYQVADVAVFPSLYEPFGIVALEAMAARCPVVVAATGGLAEVVQLHQNGMTVYPNNPESLAWGILQTLHQPEQAQIRAVNALREVREQYNWDTIAAHTADVYGRTYAAWRSGSWGNELARVAD
jgi:glycosyltransferase involved in cell wall biosynthesis